MFQIDDLTFDLDLYNGMQKRGIRKVQGVPQSQTAGLHRHQKEETNKTKQAQIEQTYEKHQAELSLPKARYSQW